MLSWKDDTSGIDDCESNYDAAHVTQTHDIFTEAYMGRYILLSSDRIPAEWD